MYAVLTHSPVNPILWYPKTYMLRSHIVTVRLREECVTFYDKVQGTDIQTLQNEVHNAHVNSMIIKYIATLYIA